MIDLIFIALVMFLSGVVQGLTGFGNALVAMPLLLFVMDLSLAVPMGLV